jgi:ubiquitin thioesterase protein OTUB1
MAFAYVEQLLENPGRVDDALNTLEDLQRKIVSRSLYPDPEEYYEPLKFLIESIESFVPGRKLTPELLLRKFQSDGKVVDISCLYSSLLNTLQNQIG